MGGKSCTQHVRFFNVYLPIHDSRDIEFEQFEIFLPSYNFAVQCE